MTALEDGPLRTGDEPDGRREDLIDAAELVIRSGNGSWKMLQRKMIINERDARRLLAALERHGIVDPEIAGQRRVRVMSADLDATLARLAAWTPDTDTPPADDDKPEPDTTRAPAPEPAGDAPTSDAGEPVVLTKPRPPAMPTPNLTSAELATRPAGDIAERPAGELATDDDEDEPAPAERQPQFLKAVVRNGAHAVHTLRHDEHWVFATARRTVRVIYTTGKGGVSWCSRLTGASNHGSSREQLRIARYAIDPDGVANWVKILDKLRNNRMVRLRTLPAALAGVGIALLVAIAGVPLLAFVVGVCAWVAWGSTGWHFWWWLTGIAGHVLSGLVVIAASSALMLAIPVVLRLLYREGLKAGDPPAWMLSTDERRNLDAEITPAKVVIALRDCGITALRNHIKDAPDGGAGMLSSIVMVGRGMQVIVALPSAVSTREIKDRRQKIAENADRYEHELLIGIPAARHVEFWFANPGALEEPIGPSPMLKTEHLKGNARTGRAPIGETLKGDPVGLSLWQKHLLITGLSNQGKTFCLRAVELWLATDFRTRFWIADLKGHSDWDMFRDIADEGRFIKGPTDQHACLATLMVEDAVREMERRLESDETTFDMLVVVIDEAQKAYTNPLKDDDGNPFGGQANNSRYCMAVRKLKNQGRVVNVVIHEGTQDPTNQNLPKITREASHIRIALVVGTPQQARMALGDAAVDGGASPHLLRQDIDQGMVVMHGGVELPRGESAVTVRFHFIDDTDAWKLATRILARRAARNSSSPLVIDAPETPDHLMAIYRAMRSEDTVRTSVILGRLIEDDEETYEEWGHQQVASVVRKYQELGIDIDIRKRLGGQSCLVLEDINRALRERPDDLP